MATSPSILRHYEIDQGRLATDLNRALERMKTGNASGAIAVAGHRRIAPSRPGCSLRSSKARRSIRSGHLLWALLADETLARRAREASGQLLKHHRRSAEARLRRDHREQRGGGGRTGGRRAGRALPMVHRWRRARSGSGALEQFTIDLTAQARAGKIDPVLGRDAEIRQIIDILTRRRQNNPILTGEAGVGKTAVVEGLRAAHRRGRRAAARCRT